MPGDAIDNQRDAATRTRARRATRSAVAAAAVLVLSVSAPAGGSEYVSVFADYRRFATLGGWQDWREAHAIALDAAPVAAEPHAQHESPATAPEPAEAPAKQRPSTPTHPGRHDMEAME